MKRRVAIPQWKRALGEPDRSGNRPRSLLKDRLSEQVRNDGTETHPLSGEIQWQLVDVLDQDIRPLRPNRTPHGPAAYENEAAPSADPFDVDPVHCRGSGRSLPSGTDQPHPVAGGGKSSEDLEELNLRSTRLRIFPVLPVDEQDVHRHRAPAV